MPAKTKKKPAKTVASVFAHALTKAMIVYQKNYHAKQLPKLRAIAQAKKKRQEELKRLQGIKVKDLRKAIMLGLSIREAGLVVFKALESLQVHNEIYDHADESWAERLVRYLAEKNDPSIKFVATREENEGYFDGTVDVCPNDPDADLKLIYNSFNNDHADCDAQEDAETLNKFILDFYGIKKHAGIKKTAKEIRAQIKAIREEIKTKKAEIKDLTAKMNKFSKSL